MKKVVSILFLATIMISSGMAVTNYNGDKDQGHVTGASGDQAPDAPSQSQPKIPDRPDTAPDKGVSSIGGVLPGQAGETAQNVLNTIDEVNPGKALGDALNNLLGNNNGDDEGNETE